MARREQGHPSDAIPRARRRLRSPERQREIVLAVVDLAREAGPEGITTQAIAERVGVTHGALFRHFPDKNAIWAAVFDWVREALGDAVGAAFAAGGTPLQTLERVFLAHVAFVARHPGVARILYHELQRPVGSPAQARVRTMVGGYRKRLGALMADAKAAGQLPVQLDEEIAAALVVGTVQGLLMQATLSGGERGMASAARKTWPLLIDGMRGAPATSASQARRRARPSPREARSSSLR